ncbi:MAG: hypothetical protein AB1644_11285 [Candidatus Zixiibacteriota bacterium]
MKRILLLIISGLLIVSTGWSQTTDLASLQSAGQSSALGARPVSSPFSLLDMSRVRWSNSYSMSFFSGGGLSGSVGLLNSTMFYDFSPKLSLALNIGILHNTGALWGQGSSDASILPGFRLDYHPSSKFSMALEVQQYSGLVNGFGRPGWWRYPW